MTNGMTKSLNPPKPWYLSKGVWGGVVALGSTLAGFVFGIEISAEDQGDLVETALQVAAAAGSIMAIIGRVIATSRIG